MLVLSAITISVGSAFQIFTVRTEKKFGWLLFLIIGTESLNGWPCRMLRVMMMML